MSLYKMDTVVIGAGVIGLAVARALALAGREVMVLEANSAIGMETSSRSSEVLHAGIYYPPASLKANTCISGHRLLQTYCDTRGIARQRCGKLVVASSKAQIPRLEFIHREATEAGVTGLELIGRARLNQMQPGIRAVAALWSPGTGIIDSHALLLALQADLEAAGGTVICNSRVTAGEALGHGCSLQVVNDENGVSGSDGLEADLVINAAGLHATGVARSISGLPPELIPQQYYARGHYFSYPGRPPFRHLVYPLPAAGGLGVHATLDLAGQTRFGPDLEFCNGVDYHFDESRKTRFTAAIKRWYPDLEETRLQPGYVGVRPKLAGPNEAFADFQISGPKEHGIAGIIHLFGIESPGLTACLALGKEVRARAADTT